MPTKSTQGTSSPDTPDWHAKFIAMLPAIRSYAKRAFCRLAVHDREEAVQAVLAYATVAYARLVVLQKSELGHATPLARFGVKQYQAGRLVGCRVNCRDVGSARCSRQGCVVVSLDDLKEVLCENRQATPADIAALRIDLSDWLRSLTPRNQRLAMALAKGEQTRCVAKMFRISAGRVSQLRQELYDSWRRFTGESIAMIR